MYRVTAIDCESHTPVDQWEQTEPVTQIQHEVAHNLGCFLDICRVGEDTEWLEIRQHVTWEIEEDESSNAWALLADRKGFTGQFH